MQNLNISRPAWAEVDLGAIVHNMRELRRIADPRAKVMAVVKADAYGHGVIPVSTTVLENGADCLAVAIFNEAKEIRAAGIKVPLLILGFTPKELSDELVNLDLTQTIFNLEGAEALSHAAVKAGKKAKIHIKLETGMGRLGFASDSASHQDILQIARLPGIEIEGIFTHFAVADEKDKTYTQGQFEAFLAYCSLLSQQGIEIPIKHVSNSAALIDLPDMHLDMVRAGISTYGLYPSQEVHKEKVRLTPAMSLKAKIAHVKTLPKGSSVSYGRRFTTQEETKIATIPVGYADGYKRALSNKAHVLVGGIRVPVIGSVCMDQFMVDVTAVPGVKAGDEAVLMGTQGSESVTADELAGLLGTINYEIVTSISPRMPRVYINKA